MKARVTEKMVCDTPPSQDVPTQQMFNYYAKKYKSCAPDSMLILENKSEQKVTVTGKWNGTIYYYKMHSHFKFGIPTSNNIRDMLQTKLL